MNKMEEGIKITRGSRDTASAKNALMERFSFDDIQAQAIVDMQLKRLTSLEIEDLRKELQELELLIEHLKDLLAHPEKILALIKQETDELAEKFGDDRRTDIVSDEVEEINIEDLIKKEQMVVLVSNLGYIKRVPVTAYKRQNRGGKGSNSAALVEDDFIDQIFTASTHDYIMFITNEGKAYWVKVHEIPEASRTSRGSHIKSLLAVSSDEEITTIVSLKEFSSDTYLLMATAGGIVKKVQTDSFQNAKTRGIIAIKLDEGDKLVSAILTTGKDELMLVTRHGQALRVSETEIRDQGRASHGVIGIRLSGGDELTGALRINGGKLLVMSENGYGKRVDFSEFSPHGRGTGGQKVYTITEKTGEVVGLLAVADDDEIVCITGQGKTIRVQVSSINVMGRAAQGVKILDIESPDQLIGLDVVAREDEEDIAPPASETTFNGELDLDGGDA